jgi:hypothetical protein
MQQGGNGFDHTKASGNINKEDKKDRSPVINKPKKKGVSILQCNMAARS